MTDRYGEFPSLGFERLGSGVLQIVLDAPRLNAVGAQMHRDLAGVWAAVDRDDDVRSVVVRGAGPAFSAGGSFDMIEDMTRDVAVRARVMREARDLGLPEAREGLAALKEKRPPAFLAVEEAR
jgi:enoyl-CoA hydratase/carnithine racemase